MRWLWKTFGAVLVVEALLAPRVVEACGPDFPPELLRDRGGTLAELPDGSFMLEATRLVPRPGLPFVAVEGAEPKDARAGGGERETALYRAGAAAFERGAWAEARDRFVEVLALPTAERRLFGPFAAFMLARTSSSDAEARQRYAEVRSAVKDGAKDPLGLAVASLGQEARVVLLSGDDVGAVALYAEQAALGSASGAQSLLFVARALATDEARARRALADPIVERLLATYVWTRADERWWAGESERKPGAWLVEALAALPRVAGADRLAAAAYRAGRFDVAGRFAAQEPSPLADWVQAKLALRRGDREEADRLLARAASGYVATEDWAGSYQVEKRPVDHLEAERAVLALARADFTAGFERTVASCAWPDIAYVAERVLTVDELKAAVDRGAGVEQRRCTPKADDESVPTFGRRNVALGLRQLLARRLLRSGRAAEALPYFDAEGAKLAERYVAALARGRSGRELDRAEALFEAAHLARLHGLELLGTEVGPDWGWAEGEFDLDAWRTEEEDAVKAAEAAGDHVRTASAARAPRGVPAAVHEASQAERERVRAHQPPSPLRFHYRQTASRLAEEAAQHVPPRSQAYAALLCQAARYASRTDPERVQALWKTYVKTGAYIPGGWSFGQSCPAPDFKRAREAASFHVPWKQLRRRTIAEVAAGVGLLVGLAWWARRRRA